MIIGIIALITTLFFGGPGEIFYVDNLEKGIKKSILDKERKKEILADFKITKGIIKNYEKQRKKDFKAFNEIYARKATTKNQLDSFFDSIQDTRSTYQNKIIDQRILIFDKIEDQEWSEIIESSVTSAEKRIQKFEKKALKNNDGFGKTKASIKSTISDSVKADSILKGIENIEVTLKELEKALLSINASDNKILANKHSDKKALLDIVKNDSEKRLPFMNAVIDFHQNLKNNSLDSEFDQIIKVFLKEANMTSK